MKVGFPGPLTRRDLLRQSLFASGMLITGVNRLPFRDYSQDSATAKEQRLGVLDFTDEVPVPMGKAFGNELDGRLYTDFSGVTPERLITPTDQFYIRTRASELLDKQNLATVIIDGLVQRSADMPIAEFVRSGKAMGAHLMECAGNIRAIHFGLMSAAEWTGVLLSDVLSSAKGKPEATRVRVSGFDEYRLPSRSSMPGASWIFSLDDLKSSGAFLATAMNGQPLTRDHGAPLRLVVPGWYGCASIKWVKQITFVDDAAESTTQMLEYASRTLQNGVPQFARDYRSPTIDQAAMPIRIERWKVGSAIRYRAVGLLWGGTQLVKRLEIQFNADERYVTVGSFEQKKNDPWSLWTHDWTPAKPGKYAISLRVTDPIALTRRLDSGFYTRSVEIREI